MALKSNPLMRPAGSLGQRAAQHRAVGSGRNGVGVASQVAEPHGARTPAVAGDVGIVQHAFVGLPRGAGPCEVRGRVAAVGDVAPDLSQRLARRHEEVVVDLRRGPRGVGFDPIQPAQVEHLVAIHGDIERELQRVVAFVDQHGVQRQFDALVLRAAHVAVLVGVARTLDREEDQLVVRRVEIEVQITVQAVVEESHIYTDVKCLRFYP